MAFMNGPIVAGLVYLKNNYLFPPSVQTRMKFLTTFNMEGFLLFEVN